MPEPSDLASQRQRRANWVGLRTLRQRPKVVGAMADGEPIYEVRNVRLVLRGQAPNFNRLVACERCGKDQAGVPVLGPGDLDAPLRPVICTECVRKAGVSSVWDAETTRAAVPENPAPASRALATPGQAVASAPMAVPEPPGAEAMFEGQLGALNEQVEELGRMIAAQQQELELARRDEGRSRSALEAAVAQAVGQIRAEVTSLSEVSVSRTLALEGQLRESLERLTHFIESQEAMTSQRVDDLAGQVAQAMARLDRLIASMDDRNHRLDTVDERLNRLAALSVALPAVPAKDLELLDALELQLQGASHRLAALSDEEDVEVPGHPGAGRQEQSAGEQSEATQYRR